MMKDEEHVKGLCLECADDLARYRRAFDAADEPILATLCEGLQKHMKERAEKSGTERE